ncbi:hypothetical protein [Marinobacter sp. PE14]
MSILQKTVRYLLYIVLFLALLWGSFFLYAGFLFYGVYSTCEDVAIGMPVNDAKAVATEAGFEVQESEVDYRYDVSKPFPESERTFEFALRFDSDASDFVCRIQHNGDEIVWSKMYTF